MIADAQSNADGRQEEEGAGRPAQQRRRAHLHHREVARGVRHLLTPKDVRDIKADLENLKQVMKQDDPAKLKDAVQRLESSAYRIADAIYADQAKTSGA